MALNYPGPYELRYNYLVATRAHQHRVSLDLTTTPSPGDAFSTMTAVTRTGSPSASTLDVDADDWIDLIRAQYNAGASFDDVELWKYTADSFEAEFVSSLTLGLSGTAGAATKAASNEIYVFRTQEGGIMKISLLDVTTDVGASVGYADLGTNQAAIVDAVLLSSNWILGRDTSYPFSFVRYHPGQSERWFKKIYRP